MKPFLHLRLLNILLSAVVSLMCWGLPYLAEAAEHPMDPLSKVEYERAFAILKESGHIGAGTLFHQLSLLEPAKTEVLQWRKGDPFTRLAKAIIRQGSRTFEVVIDIRNGRVKASQELQGKQPGLLLSEEWWLAYRLVLANREWREALQRRGIASVKGIVCIPYTVGYYGQPEGRQVKVVCYQSEGVANYWGRPIEGLIAIVDLDKGAVVRVVDSGAVTLPSAAVDFASASVKPQRKAPHPISLEQKQGPSFSVRGHIVEWQKWQFHWRIDPRVGPVISLVRYQDQGRSRSILYQGALSELFVPYMDPSSAWYFRTNLEAGEYGMGKLAVPLQPLQDCPSNAVFLKAVFVDDWGQPHESQRAACLFERDAGDIAWRHYESHSGRTEVRKRTDLVLRFIAALGNYDYVFDWIFRLDGTLKVAVGSSGTLQVKAVNSRRAQDDEGGREARYGRRVAEHTVAVNHDHFFSFRLDLDVDGPTNSFVIDRLVPQTTSGQGPRSSLWVLDQVAASREQDAKLRINIRKPALWRVVNPATTGPLGYPTSYQLKPGANALSLLEPDSFLQRRASFTNYHVWVTPYDPLQRYAAGDYPNQGRGDDGLAHWTRHNRPIDSRDIVLWYTLGFHHVPRVEDWPVMPMVWHGFELRPFNFFQNNPALDLPGNDPTE
ncbi:copper amine oxidase [Marinobacterium arenosum]|uniref:copper amine oxidase n=1 Tax=Marinobacterium arenosum TaxID=2862496 RepID=UPI001C974E41|nr:hypothetical protein [Marinobacterium arenosum]MBY4675244.1 hypothetical protein [Marinobacterium arenosum]